ncbi:Ca2+-dependent phosphoinositide-specific phospholipase C [Planotetraspora sp. A-T 1434]|uniref:Ca2+-dependent phosphoinositide-specific phospholipase C n=1 Tax=Planotetraspora sp. A-T 1434 TaxID=2979219 RepID=UPI0021BDF394|nr:Ca2+-dependent phosphoinositide-specific phospholipase C [Planotetraspora sp. A-T 1434]MCT9931573.1 Ca2+-dependent phosphoinositide-specific phospholipase C [Planotetraspora sp. A-T 1434]
MRFPPFPRISRFRRLAMLAGLVTAMTFATGISPVQAGTPTLTDYFYGGVHNAYDRAAYPYLIDALDAGDRMIEIDMWTFFGQWTVSHSNPFGNDNNCEQGATIGQLRDSARSKPLTDCLDNIKAWHDAHPDHELLIIKLEMKDGFHDNRGKGPDELDTVFRTRFGSAMITPAALMNGWATPDEGAKAHAWPTQLRGKIMAYVIRGTAENDSLPTEVEYAQHLRAHPADAQVFPVPNTAYGTADPRQGYDASLRPWFVVFDGSATGFAGLSAEQRAFYRDYFTTVTDAHSVSPTLDTYNPTPEQALTRTRLLGCLGATVISSDWRHVPGWQGPHDRSSC